MFPQPGSGTVMLDPQMIDGEPKFLCHFRCGSACHIQPHDDLVPLFVLFVQSQKEIAGKFSQEEIVQDPVRSVRLMICILFLRVRICFCSAWSVFSDYRWRVSLDTTSSQPLMLFSSSPSMALYIFINTVLADILCQMIISLPYCLRHSEPDPHTSGKRGQSPKFSYLHFPFRNYFSASRIHAVISCLSSSVRVPGVQVTPALSPVYLGITCIWKWNTVCPAASPLFWTIL